MFQPLSEFTLFSKLAPEIQLKSDIDLFFMDEWINDGAVKEVKGIAVIDYMLDDQEMTMLLDFESLELVFVVCVDENVQRLLETTSAG